MTPRALHRVEVFFGEVNHREQDHGAARLDHLKMDELPSLVDDQMLDNVAAQVNSDTCSLLNRDVGN